MGPVRVGNQAYEQVQHYVYGQIVLSAVQAYIDKRLYRMSGHEDFFALEEVGERAWKVYDQPDAGLGELRTRANVHTYSAVMCWAACDRLAHAARALGLEERETYWNDRAAIMRRKILDNALRSESACLSAVFKGDTCDASLLQLLDLRRSEEHTSELQSLMRISYAVFCLKKKKQNYTYQM